MKDVGDWTQDDLMLWSEFRAGSLQAFTTLYHTYLRPLYNYGRRFTADKTLIEDCIQDLFVELWNRREHLGNTDSARYYLFACLRHKMARVLHDIHKHLPEPLSDEYHFDIALSPEIDLIHEQNAVEQRAYVEKALQQLTRRQKEAIYLKFYEGFTYEEIANVMSLELRSVYNLISKAVDMLKRNAPKILFLLFLFLTDNN